jgi:cell division septation protein DedD
MADPVPVASSMSLPAPARPASPPASASAAADEAPTRRLYRAALGPVGVERYLTVFDGFDAAGRRGLVWHPAAAFLTLGWMVFRRLWIEALVYTLVVVLCVGLGLRAWPIVEAWPPGVRWGLAAALALVLVLAPGLTGYGRVHRQVQRRLIRAVGAARSLDEACGTLGPQASSRGWLWAVVGIHVVCLMGAFLLLSDRIWPPEASGPASQVPAVASSPAPVLPAQPPIDATDTHDGPLQGPPAPAMTDDPRPDSPEESAVAASDAVEAVRVTPAPELAPASVAVAVEPPRTAAPERVGDWAINVGLFANSDNAQRAHARLLEAGLPASVEELASPRGVRWRVRSGPFPEQADAQEAAQRIRDMGLDAAVFRR